MKNRDFKKCLITGITGSGGSFLTEHILKQNKNIKIYGLYRSNGYKKILENKFKKRIQLFKLDLNKFNSVKKIIKKIKPDLIYNFASNADVRQSFEIPREIINNNYQSTLNIFEAVRLLKLKTLIVHISTSEVYGNVSKKDVPIKETLSMRPVSPYAVSKAYQDLCAQLYNKVFGLNIIITRMFTYINPRRNNLFQSAFATQILKMKKNKNNILKHGNLKSIRTSLSLEDAMSAYWLTAKKAKVGEIYNIGGTKKYLVGEVLDKLIKITKVEIKKKIDKKLLRKKDVTLQLPNINKFCSHTSWKQKDSLDVSLKRLLQELK